MKVVVIDGQGGRLGRLLGTNAAATAAMLKGGAD